MKKIILLSFATLFLFSSCATIFTGSKKRVLFQGDVDQPVTLTIDGYKIRNVRLPYTHNVKGGFNQTFVKMEAEGYEPETIIIDKSFNAISVINLLNVVGWAIDAATGAITQPEFRFYEFEFTPEKKRANYVETQD